MPSKQNYLIYSRYAHLMAILSVNSKVGFLLYAVVNSSKQSNNAITQYSVQHIAQAFVTASR
ncbi:MAG TPA: hypothetical protein ACHBZA_07815 [Arsenophonus apicola]|uniref:hypothetical protein n=1 Tax=Arsenophonus endosymbiont of Apis mellifera TaxID=1541805 RepID=UPI0015D7A66C|nr:hypothetical protein [Arsenophonus endosymbiont of Apis mellifera]